MSYHSQYPVHYSIPIIAASPSQPRSSPLPFKLRSLLSIWPMLRVITLVLANVAAITILIHLWAAPSGELSASTVLESTTYFHERDLNYAITDEEITWLDDILWIRFSMTMHGVEWNGNCSIHTNSDALCYLYGNFPNGQSTAFNIYTEGTYHWR